MNNEIAIKPDASQKLWDFALALYAQPQVAGACLQLQDEYGANVCLLIGLCWLDARGHHLTDVDFFALNTHIHGWTQEIVEPLRSLRRRLKSSVGNLVEDETQIQLRNTIKQAELLAEKKLLMEIDKWASEKLRATNLISKNFQRYLAELKAPQELVLMISRFI